MAYKGTKKPKPYSIKPLPVMHLLSRECADAYAQELGLYDMGFEHDGSSWGSMGYKVYHEGRRCHVNVYLTRRDSMNPVFQGIMTECECGGRWCNHDKTIDEPIGIVKRKLLWFLLSMGYMKALPLLRAHKIETLLEGSDTEHDIFSHKL